MTKKIEITNRQYDWLMARGGWNKTLELVLWEVIDLVERIETDQEKYRAWIAAVTAKNEAEKGKEIEDSGDSGEERG